MKKMKAVYYNQYGGPEVIQIAELPVPTIEKDEVLIKVAGTSFNPADILQRQGHLKDFFPHAFPFIPCTDCSGVIAAVGSEVKNFRVGDKVYAFLDLARDGAAAEYVAVKAEKVAFAPKSIPLYEAGVLACAAITAWQGLFDWAHLQKNQRILITAGAGGVGAYALQLAKWKGAYVIASDSGDCQEIMKEFGADEVIDFTTQDLKDVIKEKVDVVFNIASIPAEAVTQLLQYVKRGGYLISTFYPPDANLSRDLGINSIAMNAHFNPDDLTKIAALVDQGHLKNYITERFRFDELIEVHNKAGKTHGKLLLVVDETR